LILFADKQTFIQIAGENDGPFILEYHEGSTGNHYRCERKVSKKQAQETFINYLKGDTSWKSAHEWERLERKPWWKFW
jgi:hypothetical protein